MWRMTRPRVPTTQQHTFLYGDPVRQESFVQHVLEELQGPLRLCTLSAGTTQGSVGDPIWQEAVVQHCLEELQGSLRLCTLPQALTKAL